MLWMERGSVNFEAFNKSLASNNILCRDIRRRRELLPKNGKETPGARTKFLFRGVDRVERIRRREIPDPQFHDRSSGKVFRDRLFHDEGGGIHGECERLGGK